MNVAEQTRRDVILSGIYCGEETCYPCALSALSPAEWSSWPYCECWCHRRPAI